jgi:hypothetical protein
VQVQGRRVETVVAVAVLMVASLLAGGSAGAALPRDSIEPPEIPGGSFEPPAGGFTWKVPANFGVMRDGLVDYRWNERANSRFIGPAYTYDPSYVRPTQRTAFFDGCPTEAELAAGSATTYTYTWSLHTTTGDPIGLPVSQRNCQWSKDFRLHPLTGKSDPVNVRLAITTADGNRYPGYPAGKAYDEQRVEVRDILIVSLGDSYGSGEGAPDIPQVVSPSGQVTNARWVDERCHRSANAASAVAARQLEAADPHSTVTFLSFACSGATISTPYFKDGSQLDPYQPGPGQQPHGTGILGKYRGIVPPDKDDWSEAAKLDSQIAQLTYALTDGGKTTTPREVHALTISGGGNDMGFGPVALVCTLYWECKDHFVADANGGGQIRLSDRFNQSVATMPARYAALKSALGGLTIHNTYITQYPDPSRNDSGGPCAKILDDVIPPWMAPLLSLLALFESHHAPLPPYQIDGGDRADGGEVGWAGGAVLAGMNGAVRAAATANGWTLVDGIADGTGNLFSGHGYCATDNWIRTAKESVAMQGPFTVPEMCDVWAYLLQPLQFLMGNCFPPPTTATTGTLHPTARGYQAIAGRLMAKMRPDLLPAPPPSGDPVAPILSQVRSMALVGNDGWLTGQVAGHICAGGAASCAPVQVTASVPSATSLDGVSLALNGSPLACSAAGVATGGVFCRSELTNPQTHVWSLSFTDDGIHQVEATATGRNGTRSDSAFQFKVDLGDPTSASVVPAPTATATNGWYRAPVDVQLSGVDGSGGSGVESIEYQVGAGPVQTVPDGTVVRLEADGVHSIVVRPVDRAGRRGALQPPVAVRIDTGAPTVQCGAADGGWHAADVSIACSASDGGSGLASPADAGFSLSTSVAAGSETAGAATGLRVVCDVAGHCAGAGPVTGNRVDKKAPSVTVSSPAATRYLLNQAVNADYSCADGGSGLATCAGPVPTGSPVDTSSVGTRAFTVNATDRVANPAQESVTYSVGYRVCLLYDPNRARNAGSTVPVQVQVCDAAGANVSSSALVPVAVGVVDVATGAPAPLQSPGNSQPGNRFTFDGSSYSFNLDTAGYAPGRYALQFTVAGDPVTHVAPITIR